MLSVFQMAINGDSIKQALNFLMQGGNRVADAAMKDPGQFSLGQMVQRGQFPGAQYLNQDFKNVVGGLGDVGISKVIGGAYQGKPMDVVEGGGRMLGAVQLAGMINPAKNPQMAANTVKQARDLFGRYTKSGTPMISQIRNQTFDSSASASQAAIEQALNSGNYQNALKIAQSLATNDPYRDSMIKMVTRMMQ